MLKLQIGYHWLEEQSSLQISFFGLFYQRVKTLIVKETVSLQLISSVAGVHLLWRTI